MENQDIFSAAFGSELSWESPWCSAADNAENQGIPYIGTDIRGIASGRNNSYCDIPASAYRSSAFQGIWQFRITYSDGTTQLAYCLEKGIRGANGDPYRSLPFAQALPQLTSEQIRLISYIMANSFPTITAASLFQQAGVNASQTPVLNSNDAYAATQVAIWSVLYPQADNQAAWRFINCSDGQTHPKSARLRAVVTYLYESARQRSNIVCEDEIELFEADECRGVRVGSATLTDCGNGYSEVVSGRNLYGPLTVHSELPFSLSVETICSPQTVEDTNIALVDQSGAFIQCPASGQEFYISLPLTPRGACYQVSLNTECTLATVVVLHNTNSPHLQTLGATPRINRQRHIGSLCFLYCPPCEECPRCPECPPCEECPACPTCPQCPACPPVEPCPPCEECPQCPTCPTCPQCPTCPPQKPCPPCEPCKPCETCKPCKPCKPCDHPKPPEPCEPCKQHNPCIPQVPCPPAPSSQQPKRGGCLSCFTPHYQDSSTPFLKLNMKRGYR